MILILTVPSDEHAQHVASLLEKRGADFIRFDPAQFPREAGISLSYSALGRSRALLHVGARQVNLDEIHAVWYRRPDRPVAHEEITNGERRDFVQQECRSLLQDVWQSLDACWLPARPAAVLRAQHKATQLKVAGDLGFELPPTLISNCAEELIEFYNRHQGNIVSKLAAFAFQDTIGKAFCRYTELVSRRDIQYAHSIRYCPMIFQAYVPKRVELRITIVDRRVFAAEIHSQVSHHTRHDWRRYDEYQTPHCQHRLPDVVAQLCLNLVEHLGLRYGAIDMVLTPDGRYVFLELNPNGQYLWIENETGLPISEAICDLLSAGADGARTQRAAHLTSPQPIELGSQPS